jgi:hypothetical protein
MSVSTIQHPETEFGKLAYQVDGQSDGIPLVLLLLSRNDGRLGPNRSCDAVHRLEIVRTIHL